MAADTEATVIINEFLASNHDSALDEDGDSSDWLELRNVSDSSVSLGGWRIVADNKSWVFPDRSLPSGAHLVVWASGKNRQGAELHTNFKLSSSGEYLALLDQDANMLSEFDPYPAQTVDRSYGVSGDRVGYMTPSPGQPNGGVQTVGKVAAPVASMGRGVYVGPVTETLTSPTEGAIIRYSTDGSRVSQASLAAGAAIQISPSDTGIVTVRARAYKDGMEPSAEISWSYLFPASLFPDRPAAHGGFSSRPVVVIYTDAGDIPYVDRDPGILEMIDPGKDGFSTPFAVDRFGDLSQSQPKNSFRMFFEPEYGAASLDYPIFDGYGQGFIEPATSFKRLDLRSGSGEALGHISTKPNYYLSDVYFKDSVLDQGGIAGHSRYVQLFLNGEYWGAYQLRERTDHRWYESYGSDDADSYESLKTRLGRNGLDLDNGDGSVFQAVRSGSDYQALKDLIGDPSTLIMNVLAEYPHHGPQTLEIRSLSPIHPASPDPFIAFPNDPDGALPIQHSLKSGNFGVSNGIWNHIAERYMGDPEFASIAQQVTARAVCGDGAMTNAKLRERLEDWIAELSPLIHGEYARWAGSEPTAWFKLMDTVRAKINPNDAEGDANLRVALADSGLFTGCDFAPEVKFPTEMVEVTGVGLSLSVEANDPDGDALSFGAIGLPSGLSINPVNGEIGGSPSSPGTYNSTITVTDASNKSTNVQTVWTIYGGSGSHDKLILNEYNAVDADDGTWRGNDASFEGDPENGGDWLEFVAIEDLDLRGYSIELWDRDRSSEELKMTDRFVFSEATVLANIPAGAIVTLAEDVAEDASLAPESGDWALNANVSNTGQGTLITNSTRSNFGTNRHEMRVIVRDGSNSVVAGPLGETDNWRNTGANLSAEEVMVFCAEPGDSVSNDSFRDSAVYSTFGRPNQCDGFSQTLSQFRGEVGELADVDCSGTTDSADVDRLLQHLVGLAAASYGCPVGDDQLNVAVGDLDGDRSLGLADAQLLAKCVSSASTCESSG